MITGLLYKGDEFWCSAHTVTTHSVLASLVEYDLFCSLFTMDGYVDYDHELAKAKLETSRIQAELRREQRLLAEETALRDSILAQVEEKKRNRDALLLETQKLAEAREKLPVATARATKADRNRSVSRK